MPANAAVETHGLSVNFGGVTALDRINVSIGEEELEEIVDDAIAETGATSLRDLGRVMADVMPQVAGRADGSSVSRLVREKLA